MRRQGILFFEIPLLNSINILHGAYRIACDLCPRAEALRQISSQHRYGLSDILPQANTTVEKEIVMNSGTVKWFNSTKGFGFIQPDDGSTDVFVHISAVERAGLGNLSDGQKISYDLVRDKKSGKNSADNLRAA